MWWGIRRGETGYDYSALGNLGQFIYVSPHKNLILVRNREESGIDSLDGLELFYRFASAIEAP